jgi:hypothetical protein
MNKIFGILAIIPLGLFGLAGAFCVISAIVPGKWIYNVGALVGAIFYFYMFAGYLVDFWRIESGKNHGAK